MRWGRGFFRVWVFVAVLWISAAVYLNGPKTYEMPWATPKYKFTDYNWPRLPPLILDLSRSPTEISAEIDAWQKPKRLYVDAPELEKERDKILAIFNTKRRLEMQTAMSAWLDTLIPPLVLLALGLCIVWIVRGFWSPSQPR